MAKIYLLIFILSVGIIACHGEGDKASKDSAAACKSNSINPNGNSELALLMRQMAAFTDSAKQDLLNNRTLDDKPSNLGTILTAKKTDESINKDIFVPLAQNYLVKVEQFYAAKPEEKVESLNGMVDACIACHNNFCGGPIKRIRKLYIPIK